MTPNTHSQLNKPELKRHANQRRDRKYDVGQDRMATNDTCARPQIVYRKSIANPKISQLGANLHVYNDHSLLG